MKEEMRVTPSVEKRWEQYYPEEARNFVYPKMKTFDLVYEENHNRKDAIALEYEGSEVCYGEFFDKVEEKTEFFKNKGIKENDVVTFTMLMSPDFVYDWYALGRLNAISNLIDPRTSVVGIKGYLVEAGSKIIINTDIFTPKIKKVIGEEPIEVINYSLCDGAKKMPFILGAASLATGIYSDILAKMDKRFARYQNENKKGEGEIPEYHKDQALTIVHTGGTTGTPKGVVLSHDNYNAMAYEYIKSGIGFAPNDRFLLIMPPWISYGSGMLHMSLVAGMKATIISKLESKKMPNYLVEHEPQWFAGVPAHYKIVSNSKLLAKNGVSFLKGSAVGGDAMSPELYTQSDNFLRANGASQGVYPGYALTEVTSAFAVRQHEEYKPGSVGIPLPGCVVGIFEYDEKLEKTTDKELDYNQRGEVCVQTPNQMLGYFKDPELTNQVIRTHGDGSVWVHTGDLGYLDEDGVLFVDGRIKEFIPRHDGFKIYPADIDKLIRSHRAVDDCKTIGVPDLIHGEGNYAKTYIVLKSAQGRKRRVLKEIRVMCKEKLPSYYTEGASYETIPKLPLTAVGKVDFPALEELNQTSQMKRVLRK